MASPPEQDLHPVWDRFRGTMLYPLSCGELAIPKEQILRLYVTSELHTARNKRSDSEEKVFGSLDDIWRYSAVKRKNVQIQWR